MNHPGKVFLTLTAALLLLCPQIFAQEPSGEAAPPPAEQTDQDGIRTSFYSNSKSPDTRRRYPETFTTSATSIFTGAIH